MKVKFLVREKIYDTVEYTVEVGEQGEEELECIKEEIEDLVQDFEDCGDSDDLAMRLMEEFGTSAVKMSKSGTQNLYPADCCEFDEWEDEDD